MKLIKNFKGHSGCHVDLVNVNDEYKVLKYGSDKLSKSAEILNSFKELGFYTPNVEILSEDRILMEYINGVDMKSYLQLANKEDLNKLVNFINYYFKILKSVIYKKDYNISQNLISKLNTIEKYIDVKRLNFSLLNLLERLPKVVNTGLVHGDFTLDNILYHKENFYLIDTNPTDINSITYDIVKMRQDLQCLWFVRDQKDKINYRVVCNYIDGQIEQEGYRDNNVLIFMLLRIFPYCKNKETENFLYQEVNKLWQ